MEIPIYTRFIDKSIRMPKSPTIDDISEDFKISPRYRERLVKILESQDEDGNTRFLDDRDIITRAIEVFLTWELEPEKILDELKKVKMTPQQDNEFQKLEGEPVSGYSTEEEQNLQKTARESVGDYEKMLANHKSSVEKIASDRLLTIGDDDGPYPMEHLEEIKYDGWPLLWNFYSRLLPAKITLTALGELMNRHGSFVSLAGKYGFRVYAFDIAEELAEKLRTHERQNKLGRTKKLSTGFPKERSTDNLTQGLVEKRFKDKYAAIVRKSRKTGEHIEGALAALGLITVKEYEKEYYVTMTELGKEFYKLPNPVLSGDYSQAFSDDEVKFITEKLIPQRELEDLLCKKALEIVSSGSDQEEQTKKLSEAFENVIVEFIKSYKGTYLDGTSNQAIYERLYKEYGKVVEDPNWKAELKRLQEISNDDPTNTELKDEIQKLVDIEKRLEACRVATMGRLSELGLVKWDINEKTSSTYQTDFNVPSKSYEPKEENVKKIDEYIRKHPECKLEKTRSIVIKRKKIMLPVFKLPLDLLMFTAAPQRIRAESIIELSHSLEQTGQIESGIITVDGYVIDGNRRMAALQNLVKQGRSELDYLEVVRLPGDTSSTDVWKIEAGTQLGRKDEEKT